MKPMLAGKCEDVTKLRLPVLASPKLDGVRALVQDGVLISRNIKPIPSRRAQVLFSKLPEGTDGELITGTPTAPDAYRRTVSSVMSEDGVGATFWVFDNHDLFGGFQERHERIKSLIQGWPSVKIVPHTLIRTITQLEEYEQAAVDAGHEGIMVRSLDGPYKFGRSSWNEGYLLKVKRFEDAEAIVTDTFEWEHNTNTATTNALGHTERSSHQAGRVGMGVLGGLIVRGLQAPYKDVEFRIGTGFQGADDPTGERGRLWKQRRELVGRIVKFKYFPLGSKDKPRFPVFVGWRDRRDM